MKFIHYALFFVLISLISCTSPVLFDSPQPPDTRDLNKFPRYYRGVYQNTDDSSLLYITKNEVISEYWVEFEIAKKEIDTSSVYYAKGNYLYDKNNNEKYKVVLRNDTFYGEWHYSDQLFSLSPSHVLRRYKGHLFLNFEMDGGWEVQKLSLDSENNLKLSWISEKEELEKLKEITFVEEVKDENDHITKYIAHPTKKDFNTFLEEKSFSAGDHYIKIK